MKQQDKPTYSGLTFDSVGEMHLYWWLEEIQSKGMIRNIVLQPKSFLLSQPLIRNFTRALKKKPFFTYNNPHTVIREHSYTPDIFIDWDNGAENLFIFDIDKENQSSKSDLSNILGYKFDSVNLKSYIEVKPIFDQNNMTRLAVLNQKWVYDKYGVFINIVVPEKLFDKTFTPKRFLTCDKSNRPRKINYKNIVTLEEFLENKQS